MERLPDYKHVSEAIFAKEIYPVKTIRAESEMLILRDSGKL